MTFKINITVQIVTKNMIKNCKYRKMRILTIKRIITCFFALLLAGTICQAQTFDRPAAPKEGKKAAAHKGPLKTKQVKIKAPKSVTKAKEKAAEKDKKRRKESAEYIKANQKRSIEIQTPEVQARMKQNIKDADSKYKAKKKGNSTRTRKAGHKYR